MKNYELMRNYASTKISGEIESGQRDLINRAACAAADGSFPKGETRSLLYTYIYRAKRSNRFEAIDESVVPV